MKQKRFYANCIESGYDLLSYLLENGIKIDHIISLDSEQAIKNKVSGYKSFEPIAKKYEIPIYYPEKYSMKSEKDLAFFKKEKPDLLLVHGWQRIIPAEIIGCVKIGALGDHGSSEPLPKGRGRSPINWSIIEDKKKFLLHLFFIDKEIDSGKIIDVQEFDINEWDNCKTLYHKKTVALKQMLLKNIPSIIDGSIKTAEQKGEPSYYPKRTPEDGLIDWSKSTREIFNLIRGVTRPYPGAFSFIDKNKIFFWNAQPFDTKIKYDKKKNGEIVEIFNDNSFVVKTSDSSLLITEYDMLSEDSDIYKEFDHNKKINDKATKLLKIGKIIENK